MLYLSTQEAAAFDTISILTVKEICTGSVVAQAHRSILTTQIKDQLGDDLFNQVYMSLEYQDLYTVNLKIFELIDDIRNEHQMDAKVIDDLNLERFALKRQIQEKFFPEQGALLEQKSYAGKIDESA